MKALILCGGLGTRLGELGKQVPKVMIKVNGKPCLQRHIENLKKHGITDIAINTHHLPEKIKEYFGNGEKFGVNIVYSEEKPEPLGTSGALNNFRDFFKDEAFLVVYGDNVVNFDITDAVEAHKKNNSTATLALDNYRGQEGKGVIVRDGEKVTMIIEKPEEKIENGLINSGLYVLEPEVLDLIPQGFSDFGKDILPKLVEKGNVYCVEHKGYIFDIGTLDDLEKAEEFLRTRERHNN